MKKVAVLTGGTSSERDIALLSAATVTELLKKHFEVEVYDFPRELDRFIASRGDFAAAVPVFHGKGGEDGVVQGFLKTLGVAFIFSDVTAHAVALDKALTKYLVRDAGIPTAAWTVYQKGDAPSFSGPCVVKPIDAGSSDGVRIVHNKESFASSIDFAFGYSDRVLVEDFVAGEEYTVAVIDRAGRAEALPVVAIRSKNEFFDRESKYSADLVEEICPAPIDESLVNQLHDLALRAHRTIGARHLTRSDFIVDKNGKAWFLEINTIPGQTINSLVPKALRAAGIDYADLLKEWIIYGE